MGHLFSSMKAGVPEMKRSVTTRRVAHIRGQDLPLRCAKFPALKGRDPVEQDHKEAESEINFPEHVRFPASELLLIRGSALSACHAADQFHQSHPPELEAEVYILSFHRRPSKASLRKPPKSGMIESAPSASSK